MSTTEGAGGECEAHFSSKMMSYYTLIPSTVVILIAYIFQYYKEKKFNLIPPFLSLLDDKKDRWMTIIAFGALANSIIKQVMTGFPGETTSSQNVAEATFSLVIALVDIVVIGVIDYPIFMCIAFPYRLLASSLGSSFILYKIVFLLLETIYKEGCTTNDIVFENILVVPSLVCFLVLQVQFARNMVKCLRQRNYGKWDQATPIARENDFKHVERVLHRKKSLKSRVQFYVRPWRWLKSILFNEIQISTIFSSVALIILITYYNLIVKVTKVLINFDLIVPDMNPAIRNPFKAILLVSMYFSVIVYILVLLKMIETYRIELKNVFARKDKHAELVNKLSPQRLIMDNILFPGYLVAYMAWGMILCFVFSSIILGLVYSAIYFAVKSDKFWKILRVIFLIIYKFTLVPCILFITQRLMTHFLFCPRQVKFLSLLNNIKLYHLTIYFNFFYNVLIGVVFCMLRSLMAFTLSTLCMGRIDKSPFIAFKRFDRGYGAYLGFLKLQALYKNPTMRCFVQILQDSIKKTNVDMVTTSEMGNDRNPAIRLDKRARNRWCLAYSLINNPGLKEFRKVHLEMLRNEQSEDSDTDILDINYDTNYLIQN